MKQKHLTYPFVPKTINWLIAGQFWALPLLDGTFGCARVIEIPPVGTRISRMLFFAGVLDWHSTEMPTSDSIAGALCLAQGQAHLRSITRTGGEILGFRDLAADGIEPWVFRGATAHSISDRSYRAQPASQLGRYGAKLLTINEERT